MKIQIDRTLAFDVTGAAVTFEEVARLGGVLDKGWGVMLLNPAPLQPGQDVGRFLARDESVPLVDGMHFITVPPATYDGHGLIWPQCHSENS